MDDEIPDINLFVFSRTSFFKKVLNIYFLHVMKVKGDFPTPNFLKKFFIACWKLYTTDFFFQILGCLFSRRKTTLLSFEVLSTEIT